MINELRIGSLIKDNNKIGIITNVIEQGKWTEGGLFSLAKNFEISYTDNQITVSYTHLTLPTKRIV